MIAWIDTETTGLDCNEDLILEVAVVLTQDSGEIIAAWDECVNYVHLDQIMERCEPFVQEMHTKTGLWEDCASAQTAHDVRDQMHAFLREYVDPENRPPMAGSTIGFDKNFLRAWWPDVLGHFHYRVIDVSSMKETFRRWGWTASFVEKWEAEHPKESAPHRACDDAFLSIEEWCFYRDSLMNEHAR